MESSNQKSENLRSAACYNATFLLGGEKKTFFLFVAIHCQFIWDSEVPCGNKKMK